MAWFLQYVCMHVCIYSSMNICMYSMYVCGYMYGGTYGVVSDD